MKSHALCFSAVVASMSIASSSYAGGSTFEPPPAQPTAADIAIVVAPADDADRTAPKPSPQRGLALQAGMRAQMIPFAGFDPYSTTDFLPGFSASASATIARWGRLSIHGIAEYDLSLTTADARGDRASLTEHRFGLGISPRYHVGRRLEVFAKVSPGAYHFRASLDAPGSSQMTMLARSWAWSLDTSGGGALLLGATGDPRAPYCSFWLTGELGYAWAGEASMTFSPDQDAGDSRAFGHVDLPALRAQGVMSRIGLALTF